MNTIDKKNTIHADTDELSVSSSYLLYVDMKVYLITYCCYLL